MEKAFLTVLSLSFTASYVILAVCLIRLLLKRAPRSFSYGLWLVVGFRLLIPNSWESTFSLLPFNAAPVPTDIAVQTVPRIDSGLAVVDQSVNALLPAAQPAASINPLQVYIGLGSAVWILGIALLLLYSFISIGLLKKSLRDATLLNDNIYTADNLKTPFVLSYLRPKIYLPAGLSADEQRYILLHEQIHLRRRDHLIKLGAYLILCLHWFNPLVWLAFALLVSDMEHSCDERVLRELGPDIKQAYSASLLSLAVKRPILNGSPLAFGEGNVSARIKHVLKFKTVSKPVAVIALLLVVVLCLGLGLNPQREDLPPHLTFADTEIITFGDSIEAVRETLGEPDGWLSGFWGDIYNLRGGHQVIFYYDEDGLVEHIEATVSEDWYGNPYGKTMSLADLKQLAAKGDNLRFEDLSEFRSFNFSSNFDTYIMDYSVDGGYLLLVNSPDGHTITSAYLEGIGEPGRSGIDIRYENLDDYLVRWPVQMMIKDGTITPTGATIVLKNNTEDTEFIYGVRYQLRYWNNNTSRWVEFDTIHEENYVIAIGYSLPPTQEKEQVLNWEDLYGQLPSGSYKLVKEVSHHSSSGEVGNYVLFAPFTI